MSSRVQDVILALPSGGSLDLNNLPSIATVEMLQVEMLLGLATPLRYLAQNASATSCMVDLIVRAGRGAQANDMSAAMPSTSIATRGEETTPDGAQRPLDQA
eukprot:2171408-Karenia_brevis.AAC.1